MKTMVYKIEDEELERDITVIINRVGVISDLQNLIENHNAGPESEYPSVGRTDINGNTLTQEARNADLLEIQNVIGLMTDEEGFIEKLTEIVQSQPRKKNSSLAKGRVQNVFQFDSFGSYWEDSYGTNTPAIRARAKDDYEMEIVYEEYIVKY